MENFETYRLDQTGQQTQAILDQVSTNTADIAQLRALYEALTQSEPVIIQPSDTWPVADPEENVIYRVIDRVNTPPQSYSDYMWNGTAMVLMATYNNAIDDEPTAGSNNLAKSGGIYKHVGLDLSTWGWIADNDRGELKDVDETIGHRRTSYVFCAGARYKIKAKAVNTHICIAFYDAGKLIISSIKGTNSSIQEETFEGNVPNNAVYMAVCSLDSANNTNIYAYLDNVDWNKFPVNFYGDENLLTTLGFLNIDGEFVDVGGWTTSDYIKIPAGSKYSAYLYCQAGATSPIVFYDKNKKIIKTVTGAEDGIAKYTGIVPEGTFYTRICTYGQHDAGSYYLEMTQFGYYSESILPVLYEDMKAQVIGWNKDFKNYGFIDVNGVVHDASTWYNTDIMCIPSKAHYKVYVYAQQSAVRNIIFYDKNKNILPNGIIPSSTDGMTLYDGVVPDGAFYVRLCTFADPAGNRKNSYFSFVADELLDTIDALCLSEKEEKDTKLLFGNNFLRKPYDFNGKTAIFFGDSVTYGVKSNPFDQADKPYREWLCEKLGLTGTNDAVSGSYICDLNDSSTSILNKVLNDIDANTTYDYIFIAGGINDFWTGKPLGTISDNTYATFYGALNVMCNHLKTVLSEKETEVIFITPINCTKNDLSEVVAPLNAYRNAIFMVAVKNGFNVVDSSKIGFPEENTPEMQAYKTAVIEDGVHPTEYGHQMMGLNIAAILSNENKTLKNLSKTSICTFPYKHSSDGVDMNSLPDNIITFVNGDTILHSPEPGMTNLFVINADVSSSNANIIIQTVFSFQTGETYTRYKIAGVWQDYKSSNDNLISFMNVPLTPKPYRHSSDNVNFNTVEHNKVYFFNGGDIPNAPTQKGHNLFLIDADVSRSDLGVALYIQICFDQKDGVTYTRFYQEGQGWSAWVPSEKEFHVGTGQEYTSVTAAVTAANALYLTTGKIYNVVVHEGEYDILQEGAESLNNGRGMGLCCNVIGMQGAVIKAHRSTPSDDFSPFNILNIAETRIENITIDIENCRYCVHDELGVSSGTPETPNRHIYKNVHFINRGWTSGSYRAGRCLGIGLGGYVFIDIDNCIFESSTDDTPIDAHSSWSDYQLSPSKVIVHGCYFKNGTVSATSHGSTMAYMNEMYVHGNSVESEPFVTNGDETNMKMYKWNNDVRI